MTTIRAISWIFFDANNYNLEKVLKRMEYVPAMRRRKQDGIAVQSVIVSLHYSFN